MTGKNYEYTIGEIYEFFLTMKRGTFINMPPFVFQKKKNSMQSGLYLHT